MKTKLTLLIDVLCILAFLTFSILGFCNVLTPAIACMLVLASLALLMGWNGYLQWSTNRRYAKIDLFVTGALILCFFVTLALRLTDLMP